MAHDELKRIRKVKEATVFKFAINKLIIVLKGHKVKLEEKWKVLDLENNPTEWESIYASMKLEVEELYKVNSQSKEIFLTEVSISSKYKEILFSILKIIDGFNEVGDSIYKAVAPFTEPEKFPFQKSLSLAQEKTKWWELEDKLKMLYKIYQEEIDKYLIGSESVDFEFFRKVLEGGRKQLKEPLELIAKLNIEYNKEDTKWYDAIIYTESYKNLRASRKVNYHKAYSEAYMAVNYEEKSEKLIKEYLEEKLEKILIRVTK